MRAIYTRPGTYYVRALCYCVSRTRHTALKHIDVELGVIGPPYCSDQQQLLLFIVLFIAGVGYRLQYQSYTFIIALYIYDCTKCHLFLYGMLSL